METYVTKLVVDICTRKFLLIDNEGNEQIVECDTPEEFNNVLNSSTSSGSNQLSLLNVESRFFKAFGLLALVSILLVKISF